MAFRPTAASAASAPVNSSCVTEVAGVPGVLLEVVDLEDPIEVGKEVTYEIRVTNQGSALLTNIRLVSVLPASQELVSASGSAPLREQTGTLTADPVAQLASQATASWRVVAKAVQRMGGRVRAESQPGEGATFFLEFPE